MECIKFNDSFDADGILWRDNIQAYDEYLKSHKWKKIISSQCFMKQCEKCKTIMQNPGGGLNFMIMCRITLIPKTGPRTVRIDIKEGDG